MLQMVVTKNIPNVQYESGMRLIMIKYVQQIQAIIFEGAHLKCSI